MIHEVEKHDIAELKTLAQRTIVEAVQADPDIKEEIISDTWQHIESSVSSEGDIFLKHIDPEGVIQGFIILRGAWNLSDLFVDPEVHENGVGRSLFEHAKVQAKPKNERGYIRANSSLNAENFYRKLGFESYSPEKFVPDFVVPLIYQL